jgi:hypothetical protein
MGITNSRFKTSQSISGIKFVWDTNGDFAIIGYYTSPEYKNKSEYNYQPATKSNLKCITAKFEQGYYLKRIIHEINDEYLTVIFQIENSYGQVKPIRYEKSI